MLKDIIEVKPLNNYQLYLKFEDDQDGIIDLEEIIEFVGIFQPLKDLDFFKTVKINPDWGTIYWENGADLDPDVLYSIITDQSLDIETAEGQQVIIQNNEGQDFQIISLSTRSKNPRYGSAKGVVKMLDNFDDPIEDFEDYMP